MTSDAAVHRPFTLWLETLPTEDTARVLIWPGAEETRVVFYWNYRFHSVRCFTSRATAEAWGYELHRVLRDDVLAGVLLGYDREVLDRLQSLCSPC